MGMRIRVLSGCLAIGATAVILTGTAAHATPLGGSHSNVVTTASTEPACPGQGDNQDTWNQSCKPSPCQTGVDDNNYNGNNGDYGNGYQSCKPTPKPTCTCEQTTPPTPPTIVTPSTTLSTAPVPQVTSTKPVTPTSSAPSVAPVTGGGGSIGGGDGPLAAGGVAIALAAGLIGTFAYRRWRRTRSPAA